MRGIVKILLLLALLAGLGYWGAKKAGFGEPEKIDYLTETVRRGDIRKVVNATGEIGAVQLVNVGAQVSGQIEKLHVVLGQQVKKGEPVAEIDSTTQANDLAINRAKLKTYEAQLVSREIDLKVAQTQYDRQLALMARDATSKENLENAENALASARAGVAETKSLVEQTKISVSTAEVNLGYTRISAPLDGTVVSIPVEEGQTVNANQTTPTIAQIADLSHMEVKMQISEGDVTRVRPGMPVTSTILSEPDRMFRGKLATIDPGLTNLTDGSYSGSADSSSAVYYYGKLVIPNTGNALRIGMTTQNTIVIDQARDVLVVPTLAIQYDQPARPSANGVRSGQGLAAVAADEAPPAPAAGPSEGQAPRPDGAAPAVAPAGGGPAASPSPAASAARAPSEAGGEGGGGRSSVGIRRRGQAYVRVLLEDGAVQRRDIEVGLSDNQHTEVKSGLNEGDRVITAQMTASEINASINSRGGRGPGGPGGPGGPPRR